MIHIKNGITDDGLRHFQKTIQATICKEDIFYYIYGMLHSFDYREKYANNLSKQLPRIPRVGNDADFFAFRDIGIELAKTHIFYEQAPLWQNCNLKNDYGLTIGEQGVLGEADDKIFYVEKMKLDKKSNNQTVIYNEIITIEDIPQKAWNYHVGSTTALNHVIQRQAVIKDKDSGIVNNANDWAIETMGNPRYPLELFLRVITVSMVTLHLQEKLPRLNFDRFS